MFKKIFSFVAPWLLFVGCAHNGDSVLIEPTGEPEPSGPKYKVNPTPDPNQSGGIYIPKDLDDSFAELKKMLHPDFVKEFKVGTEDDTAMHHFGLGIWMRNNWGLWGGSRLAKWFNAQGIKHADDMSGIILDSFWRHLNNKPIKLDKQVKYYQDYWKKQKAVQPKDADDKK